uniref:Uncharacterized protein n=1 Tax=Ditylenchus dipsaci TaxID=166011 RepID=A0A915D1I8_9BILA
MQIQDDIFNKGKELVKVSSLHASSSSQPDLTVDDFEDVVPGTEYLGMGAFGEVWKVQLKKDKSIAKSEPKFML